MRVLVISLNYPPENSSSAKIAADVAEEMVRRGHEVTVIAPFPNRPAGILYPGYRRSLCSTEQRDGYRVIHTWSRLSRSSGLVSRFLENLTFGLTSMIPLFREPRPDVVYMNTWPLFAECLNSFVLWLRRVPVFCCIKDLYPETYLDGRSWWQLPIIWFTQGIDRQTHRQCRMIAPLNDVMADHIASSRQLEESKIRVTPDWVDASLYSQPASDEQGFRASHGIPESTFLAMYLGNITRMAGLDIYLDAAKKLRHRDDICFVLAGDGSQREAIAKRIEAEKLTNVRMIYPVTPDQVPHIQSAANVLMVSLAPGMALHATPSKLIYYMFSGRPVLASVDPVSAAARIVRDAECGLLVRQGDAGELAEHLERMADDRSSLELLGQNARDYADQHFSKQTSLPSLCDFLEEISSSPADETLAEIPAPCSVTGQAVKH